MNIQDTYRPVFDQIVSKLPKQIVSVDMVNNWGADYNCAFVLETESGDEKKVAFTLSNQTVEQATNDINNYVKAIKDKLL